MTRITIIECCNYRDFPAGGQLTFAKQMVECFGDELVLVGIAESKSEVGVWTTKSFGSTKIQYFGYIYLRKSPKRPLVPNRLKSYLALRHYRKQIVSGITSRVIVRAPDTLIAIATWGIPDICFYFPGTENPLAISRYKFARIFADIFDLIFFRSVKTVSTILAASDREGIEEVAKRSKNKVGVEAIRQFPTRVDFKIFHKKPKSECRERLGLPSDTIIAVTTGRIAELKGWRFLVDSFAIFQKRKSPSVLIFVGDGEDKQGLLSYVRVADLIDKVLVTGYQSADSVADYLCAADLFVMGSYKEGWSTSLIEALACGTPVCTTIFSSARDCVAQGRNGYVVESRSPKIFANYMEKTLDLNRDCLPLKESRERFSLETLKEDLFRVWPAK